MADDGMSSHRINKKLLKVISNCTTREWQHFYGTTNTIDLITSRGRSRILGTKRCHTKSDKKGLIIKVDEAQGN